MQKQAESVQSWDLSNWQEINNFRGKIHKTNLSYAVVGHVGIT